MRPGDARLISPSSIQNFHSTAGTLISAFGNAGLLSAVEQAVHVVAVEMRDHHHVDRVAVDAGGREIAG